MKRHFSGYIAFGIGLWISMQTFVSIGVNLGILPTKGLTLPLISSGGSSVLMTCAAMGLLLRVSYELKRAERRQAVHRWCRTQLLSRWASQPCRWPPARRSAPGRGPQLQQTPRAAPAAFSRVSNRPSGGCHERGHR